MPKGNNPPPHQDWQPQVFNFEKRDNQATRRPQRVTQKDANRAIQSGQVVQVEKKEHIRANQQTVSAGANAKKLDEDHDNLKVKRVDPQLRTRIMKARQQLNWSQQDLAQQISQRATVVTQYENGKAVPQERVIVKMEKAFGLYLRGVNAGKPFGKHRPTPKPKE